MPFTIHVTLVFVVFVTVALNCCVAPRSSAADVGATLTLIGCGVGGGGGGGGEEPPPVLAQPVARSTATMMRALQVPSSLRTDSSALRIWRGLVGETEAMPREEARVVPMRCSLAKSDSTSLRPWPKPRSLLCLQGSPRFQWAPGSCGVPPCRRVEVSHLFRMGTDSRSPSRTEIFRSGVLHMPLRLTSFRPG